MSAGRVLFVALTSITAVAIGTVACVGLGYYLILSAPPDVGAQCQHSSRQARIDACTAVIRAETSPTADLSWAYVSRGNAYTELGQYRRALDDYNAALLQVPDSSAVHNNRGYAYYMLGQDQRALAEYDVALKLQPGDVTALRNRGTIACFLGRCVLAVKDFDAALRLSPHDATALYGRGRAYIRLGQYDSAIRDFDAAIRLEPKALQILASRGTAYGEAGQYQRAIADLDVAIGDLPNADNLNSRCWARAVWGHELDAALADCNRSLKLQPDSFAADDSRALVYFRMGNYGAAIADAHAALGEAPALANSLYVLGLSRLRTGDERNGNADIAEAKKHDPNIEQTYAGYGVKP